MAELGKASVDVLKHISEVFQVYGDFVTGCPYGSGHINDTYKIEYSVGGTKMHYLLQRINHHVFTQPANVQQNILRVTRHIAEKLRAAGDGDISRRTLTLILTHAGEPVHHDVDGNWWRMYIFVEGAQTYDQIQSVQQAELVGEAFAGFQNMVADLTQPRLHETIPNFHNTAKRYEALQAAIQRDAFNRAKDVKKEIEFVAARANTFSRLIDRCAKGEIPERITHNDTKLNNVMLDDVTGKGICVIDLDTVMPGLALYDFGDMCRTSTANAAEDEQDLSKVYSRMEMFEGIARGYCRGAKFLVKGEKEELAFSARLITMTIGIRFLTDYLSGDVYFHVKRPGHNIDRCRTQLKMVQSMEDQAEQMEAIIQKALTEE
ncbi:MAG: aminoglycoside phosphotransferase family protein [Kiritimatiellia bacterium]